MPGICLSTSPTFVLYFVYLCCIFYVLITFVFTVLNFVFFTTSLLTASFNFLQSTGTVFNAPTSKPSTFAFKFFKIVGTLTNLLMSSF